MKRSIYFGVLVGVLVLLQACTSALIKPGQLIRIQDLSVQSPVAWTQFGSGRSRTWTRDGPALNSLMLVDGIKDREHVFLQTRTRQMRKGEGALYRAGMTDIEVVELLADGLQSIGAENVQTLGVRPFQIAAVAGFFAEYAFQNEAGLHYRALVVGESTGNTLSYGLFYAPAEFYFERERASVEAIFSSIRQR
jgi:hypothetical protein